MGREPVRGLYMFRRFDSDFADRVAKERMDEIGIKVRDPHQAVGTMSGGERQCHQQTKSNLFWSQGADPG